MDLQPFASHGAPPPKYPNLKIRLVVFENGVNCSLKRKIMIHKWN